MWSESAEKLYKGILLYFFILCMAYKTVNSSHFFWESQSFWKRLNPMHNKEPISCGLKKELKLNSDNIML